MNTEKKNAEAAKPALRKKKIALAVFLGLILCLFSAFLLFGRRDPSEKMTTASGKQENPLPEGASEDRTGIRSGSPEEPEQTKDSAAKEQAKDQTAKEQAKRPDQSGDGEQPANEDNQRSSGDGEIAKAAQRDYHPSGSDDQDQENTSPSNRSDQEARENSDDPDQQEPGPKKTHFSTIGDLLDDIELPELEIPFLLPSRETEDSQDNTDYTEDQDIPEEETDYSEISDHQDQPQYVPEEDTEEYTDDLQQPDDTYTEDDTSYDDGTDPAQESPEIGDIFLPEVP